MKRFINQIKSNWTWQNTILTILGISLISTSFITWNCLDIFIRSVLFIYGIVVVALCILDAMPQEDSEI